MPVDGDFDVKITLDSTTERFKLVQQRGTKLWTVREVPPNPQPELSSGQEEGWTPTQLLPFQQEDWSIGAGLSRLTPQLDRAGHTLRYADGFGIDTSEVGLVRHGPALLSDVGSVVATPIMGLMFDDKVWFLTAERLYNWDGTTLTLFWTNADGSLNTHMAVHGSNLFVAASNTKYWITDGTTTPASRAFAVTKFLSLNDQLWRVHTTNQISSSTDPDAASPTWAADIAVGPGETVTSLFSISGLLGAATESSFYIIDSLGNSIEMDNRLRSRRSANAHTIAAGSGSSVWFANENKDDPDILRLVADGFEQFDVQFAGPFYGNDEVPVNAYDPRSETLGIVDIMIDVEFVYVLARRGTDTYCYKGKEVARNVYAWSPILKYTGNNATMGVIAKMSGDSAPVVYFNGAGTTVNRFATDWDEYASSWELITPKFTAGLESWEKMANILRAFLERESNTTMTCYYRTNNTATWTLFASPGTMTTNGVNKLTSSTPVQNNSIQLRFVGSTTNSANKLNMRSFLLEEILRPEERSMLDFSVIVENKSQATFLHNLRKENDSFPTIVDRLGQTWNVFVMPGYPIESEVTDEVRKGIVRSFHLLAQSVG